MYPRPTIGGRWALKKDEALITPFIFLQTLLKNFIFFPKLQNPLFPWGVLGFFSFFSHRSAILARKNRFLHLLRRLDTEEVEASFENLGGGGGESEAISLGFTRTNDLFVSVEIIKFGGHLVEIGG